MIDKNIMEDFIFRVQNDGTIDMIHEPCRELMRTLRGVVLFPINLAEAYEAAENHLLNLCPGGHSIE